MAKSFLIVGASGTSGQAAVEAIRQSRKDAVIFGSTSSDRAIAGCDHTIKNIGLDEGGSLAEIERSLSGHPPVELLVYIPAKGRVAMSATSATKEQVRESLAFSVHPMLKLMDMLKPDMTVCLSAFYNLPTLRKIYGAMNFTKIAMDKLAIAQPHRLKSIRIGRFESNAVRGISLLVQRAIKSGDIAPDSDFALAVADSGLALDQYLLNAILRDEETHFSGHGSGPYRQTETRDITAAFKRLLDGEPAPIMNVIGSWYWTDDQLLPLPPELSRMTEELLSDLP